MKTIEPYIIFWYPSIFLLISIYSKYTLRWAPHDERLRMRKAKGEKKTEIENKPNILITYDPPCYYNASRVAVFDNNYQFSRQTASNYWTI